MFCAAELFHLLFLPKLPLALSSAIQLFSPVLSTVKAAHAIHRYWPSEHPQVPASSLGESTVAQALRFENALDHLEHLEGDIDQLNTSHMYQRLLVLEDEMARLQEYVQRLERLTRGARRADSDDTVVNFRPRIAFPPRNPVDIPQVPLSPSTIETPFEFDALWTGSADEGRLDSPVASSVGNLEVVWNLDPSRTKLAHWDIGSSRLNASKARIPA